MKRDIAESKYRKLKTNDMEHILFIGFIDSIYDGIIGNYPTTYDLRTLLDVCSFIAPYYMGLKNNWRNVVELLGTPLPNPSGITGVMLCCSFILLYLAFS